MSRGFRLVINNGPDGGESVPHLHVHVLGGRPMACLRGEDSPGVNSDAYPGTFSEWVTDAVMITKSIVTSGPFGHSQSCNLSGAIQPSCITIILRIGGGF